MLKNKWKFIIFIFAAAMMLVGCADERNISIPNYSFGSNPPPDISTPSDEPNNEALQTIVFCNDPENQCTISTNGETITISGKSNTVLRRIVTNTLKFTADSYSSGDIVVVTLSNLQSTSNSKFVDFYILDKNGSAIPICMEYRDDGVFFPDLSKIVENNRTVSERAVEISEARVAQFITLDGSREKIPQILSEIKELSDKICTGIDSDYEKLRAISYWVAENIYYDKPAYDDGIPQSCLSLEYMLNNKSSVCGGYSNMTSALCAAQGIRCLNIIGQAVISGYYCQNLEGVLHEWNVAEIDGKSILVDTTWSSNNRFSDGSFDSKPITYGYFDIGEDVMALCHKARTAEYRNFWALA